MAKAVSISLSNFNASVQAAVKSAVAQHPKFAALEQNKQVEFFYWIWGIPAWESVLRDVTVAEAQAFADTVAGQIAPANPEAFGPAAAAPEIAERLVAPGAPGRGAVLSTGGHVTIGIPPVTAVQFR